MIKYFTIEDLLKHYLQKKFHILEHETEHLNSCNEYLQNLQSDLAEKEDYEIME